MITLNTDYHHLFRCTGYFYISDPTGNGKGAGDNNGHGVNTQIAYYNGEGSGTPYYFVFKPTTMSFMAVLETTSSKYNLENHHGNT